MSEQYLIYLRKSRGDAELEALGVDVLERHERTLLELAKKMNLSIGGIYREIVSGDSISSRPEMQKLLHEVESGYWKGVLVMEVERLARGDTIDQGIVQRSFQYSDTLIVTPTKIYDPSNEFDQEYFEFGLFMSRREYQTIKRRMQAGRYAAAKEGKWPFNSAPYGFHRVKLPSEKGWTLDINESEREIVRLIFSLFTEPDRIGVTLIKNYLNERKIKSRTGGLWTDCTIREILMNPVYDKKVAIGRRKIVKKIVNGQPVKTRPRTNPDIYEGRHPRMIESDVFQEAQSYLGLGAPKPPESYGVKNPLSGLIVCGECGKKMQRRPATKPDTKNGAKYDTLLCNTSGCPTVGSSLALVEREIIHILEDWVSGYELLDIMPESRVPEKERLLDVATQELNSLCSQNEKLYDFLEQGVYSTEIFLERSSTLQNRINEARDKVAQLNNELSRERKADAHINRFIPACKQLLNCYWELSIPEKNKALKLLISSVEYKKYAPNGYGDKDIASFDLVLKPRIPRG